MAVSRSHTPITVDLGDPASVRAMYAAVGRVDAVVSAAGSARFAPLDRLSDDDLAFSLGNKLMGQVNLVRFGLAGIADGGSFTLTSGVLARLPMPGSAAISLVNAGLEGFVRAAALEAPRGIRVNIVSPPWVTETLVALKMDPSHGLAAATVARAVRAERDGPADGRRDRAGRLTRARDRGPGAQADERPWMHAPAR